MGWPVRDHFGGRRPWAMTACWRGVASAARLAFRSPVEVGPNAVACEDSHIRRRGRGHTVRWQRKNPQTGFLVSAQSNTASGQIM